MADGGQPAQGSGRDGEKHGWLTLDRYVAIHRGALERHPFVLADRTEFDQPATAPGFISLQGQVICEDEVVIEIEKYLTVRLNNRNQIEARGRRYRYHAHIPGRGNLLRYDNSHGFDEFHRHEYVFPTEDQRPLEVLTREEFPTLIEVIDEVQAMAADLGLPG